MVNRKDTKKKKGLKSPKKQWLPNLLLITAILCGFLFRYSLWKEMGRLPVEKDAALYCTMAENMVNYGVFSGKTATGKKDVPPTAYTMPGYPMFLSVVYFIFGRKPWPLEVVRFLQILLSLGLIVVGYYFGKFLSGRWAGVVNAFVMALYPSNIFAPQMVLTECLFTVLTVVSVYFLLIAMRTGWEEKKKYIQGLAAGISMAAAFAIRPTLLPFAPFIMIYLMVDYLRKKPRPGLKRLMQAFLVIFVPLLIFWAAWTLRNAIQFGHFIPLTTSSNNPKLLGLDYKGKYVSKMFEVKGDEYEGNKQWGEWAKAAFWENMKENPKAYLKHLLSKAVPLLAIPFGVTPAEGWERMHWRGEYWFYRAHRFLFWLALLGIMLLLPKRKEVSLVVILMVVLVLLHMSYLATNRYGYPLIALVLNFVGVTIVNLYTAIAAILKKGGWKKYVAVSSIVVAIGLVILRCPFMFPWFTKYFILPSLIGLGILGFWIIYALRWIKEWKARIIVVIALLVFYLNFWGAAQSFKVWGIAPERIHSFGYLYSDKDIIEQIIDISDKIKEGDRYYLHIGSRRGSSDKPTYIYQIFVNGSVAKEVRPDESLPQDLSIQIPSELVHRNSYLRVSLRLKGNVDVYSQYVLVNLRLDRFLGISLFDGQMEDLSYRKSRQKGTFEIGLVVKKGERERVWYGSARKKLLAKLRRGD